MLYWQSSLTTGKSAIALPSTNTGVIDTRPTLRIIRSMFSHLAFRSALSLALIHKSISNIGGCPGAGRPTPASRGPTPKRFGGWADWKQVAALSLLLGLHADSGAQTLPTVAVERDGDTFHVRARASVAVDPRIAWETITDYERMREFLPNVERSRIVARSGTRLTVEHSGAFPLFVFDIPVRVRLAVQQQPYERVVARSEPGEVNGEPQTLRSFLGTYDLAVVTVDRRAGVRLEYESRFELADPLPPIIGHLFGTAMVTKTVRNQFEAMLREMQRRQAGRASIEKSQ